MGRNRGFTLIEALILTAIICILAAIIIPKAVEIRDQNFRHRRRGYVATVKLFSESGTLLNEWRAKRILSRSTGDATFLTERGDRVAVTGTMVITEESM